MTNQEEDRHTLKYPEMREELIETLRSLADADYQRETWLDRNFPSGTEHDCFDYAVHFIYDDTRLATDPEGSIGLFLKNQQEVQLIKAVAIALDRVFDTLGMNATDEQYINCPEWSQVLTTASRTLQAMKEDSH